MKFEKGKSGNPATQFSSEYQPKNRGRKKKSVSEFLKEYGEGNKIDYEIKIYEQGKTKKLKGSIESETSINELIAFTIIKNAVKGDFKAMNVFLERTEGKVAQNVNLGSDDPDPIVFKVIK